MGAFIEALVVLLCLAGTYCLLCALFGRLLLTGSTRGTWVIVWGVGAGEELEQRVRALMYLRGWGLLRCSVLLVDAGLDPTGRALAARLASRWPALTLCTRQELERRLE